MERTCFRTLLRTGQCQYSCSTIPNTLTMNIGLIRRFRYVYLGIPLFSHFPKHYFPFYFILPSRVCLFSTMRITPACVSVELKSIFGIYIIVISFQATWNCQNLPHLLVEYINKIIIIQIIIKNKWEPNLLNTYHYTNI